MNEVQVFLASQRVQHSLSELERLWTLPQETLKRIYEGRELAQKILSWIERTRTTMEQDARTYEVTRESVLIDDIEKLCQEQLQKGST